jgi:hypothetical protein
MFLQIFRVCKNTAIILAEELMDTAVPFTRKKHSKRLTQSQIELQDLEDDKLPEVKFD